LVTYGMLNMFMVVRNLCLGWACTRKKYHSFGVVLYLGSILTSLLFLVVNLTCAMLIHGEVPEKQLRWTVLARALVNDSLFILCAISLACCMCKLGKMSSANVYLESKGTSVCQAILVGSVVALLYSSRACYNLVAVAISPDNVPGPFNYGWDNLSDKVSVSSEEYVVFGVVLFLWELVPTTFVVLFFRAQRLTGMVNSHSYSSRAYFFDNPRRYDSDDDLSRLGAREGGTIFLDYLGWQVRAVSLVADGPLSDWPSVWVLLLCPVDSEPTAPPGAGPVFY
uniref:G protein-coupled receptor 137C n=1 Tax=Cyanistes caeruleus TaxID=156563 RepID=A0A8C0U2Q1_CYACU